MIVPILGAIGFSAVGTVLGEGGSSPHNHITLNKLVPYRLAGTLVAGILGAVVTGILVMAVHKFLTATAMGERFTAALLTFGRAVVAAVPATTRVIMVVQAAYEDLNLFQAKGGLPSFWLELLGWVFFALRLCCFL